MKEYEIQIRIDAEDYFMVEARTEESARKKAEKVLEEYNENMDIDDV